MEFSQSIIAELIGVSRSFITKTAQKLELSSVSAPTSKFKKYDVPATRKLIKATSPYRENRVSKKVQVFYNFKGGTGKTSISFQVATHLSIMGYNVLAIDLDPQGHLSSSILGTHESLDAPTLYDLWFGSANNIQEIITPVNEGLDLICGNLSLTRVEVPLNQKPKREEVLNKTLQPVLSKYDYIIIDTNPTISTLNMNALVAADHVNVIAETQPYALNGLGLLIEELLQFYDEMGTSPDFSILANKYESRTSTAQEVIGALRSDYGEFMKESVIRKSEDINLSSKYKLPVAAFATKKSAAFEDIKDFIHEFIKSSTTNGSKLV